MVVGNKNLFENNALIGNRLPGVYVIFFVAMTVNMIQLLLGFLQVQQKSQFSEFQFSKFLI